VPQADLPAGDHDGVEVVYPDRRGRDAADDRILALLDAAGPHDVGEVVTSDRGLADGVHARGLPTVGAKRFLTRLDEAGC
jgi:hypothetical protein